MLDGIARASLRTNLAIKPTHLGLALDSELTCDNLARLTAHAAAHGNFVRMDMEESRYVDPTLEVYRRLRSDGTDNVGIVLQAYLYRSEARSRKPARARAERPRLQGGVPRAPRDRVSGEAGRRRRLRAPARARATPRRVRRHRDARRADDRARDRVRGARADPGRALPVPDALRRPPAAPALARPPWVPGARGDAVRPRLVPVPHAPPRRAAREHRLPAAEPSAARGSGGTCVPGREAARTQGATYC